MRRRDFIAGLGAAADASPHAGRAQPLPVVGWWLENKNTIFALICAQERGSADQLLATAGELLASRPDVILADLRQKVDGLAAHRTIRQYMVARMDFQRG